MSLSASERELARQFARDLSTCTVGEILQRWSERDREGLERIAPGMFKRRLTNHNPIYYLAEQVFFDNMRWLSPERAKRLLYAPLHRDRLAAMALKYYQAPLEETSGLLTLMMRGSYKSTFFHGVVPLWITLREWHLNKHHAKIALLHQLEDKASSNLMRLKSKALAHPWMKLNWGEFCADRDFGTKTEFNWPNQPILRYAAEADIIARGIGADLTGFHFDHIFFSDLVVAKQITSQQERTMTKKRHDATTYTIISGKPWYDGTRYHARDLYGDMLDANVEGEKLYWTLQVKAIEADGTLSLPFKYSYEILERMRQKEISRSGSDLLWHLQMQCDVRTSHSIAADWAWVRHVPISTIKPTGFRVITVDPAWKGTEENFGKGDFASIQVWNLERRGGLVIYTLLDGVHSNELTDEMGANEIFRLMGRYNVLHVAPEERGGYSFRTRMRNESITRGKKISIIDLETQQRGKPARITTFLGQAEAGRVQITNECNRDLAEAFENQFRDYPQLEHNDALDAAAYVCDPGIATKYGPMFGGVDEDGEAFGRYETPYLPRTRYTMS